MVSRGCENKASESERISFCVPSNKKQILEFYIMLHHRPVIKAKEIFLLTGHSGKHTEVTLCIPVQTIYSAPNKEQKTIFLSVYWV